MKTLAPSTLITIKTLSVSRGFESGVHTLPDGMGLVKHVNNWCSMNNDQRTMADLINVLTFLYPEADRWGDGLT